MRRIDDVKNKTMKNVKFIKVLDEKRIQIVFKNNQEIILKAESDSYGYDAGIFIEKDNVTHI